MRISNLGLNLIKKYEGCRLTAYKDAVGIWTIGYGHTRGVKEGQTITPEQADDFLRSDLENAEKHVTAYDSIYHFSQSQFDALVSFTYNCGAGNLKKLTNGGKRTVYEISDAIPNYNKAGGKVLKGLVRRRNDEKAMFDKGMAKKSVTEVANEVLRGIWGNGTNRKSKLIKAGYDYNEVQAEVNRILKENDHK